MKSNSYSISPIFTVATIAFVLAGRILLPASVLARRKGLDSGGYGTAVEIVDGETTVLYEAASSAGQSTGTEIAAWAAKLQAMAVG